MTRLIANVFRKAGVNAKVSKDKRVPRFKVQQSKLTLEGIVKGDKYKMRIKDTKGKLVDSLEVSVKNDNDVINRINESLNTLKMLSEVYDHAKLVEEDEEYDTIDVEEEVSGTLEDGLNALYDSILDVAEQADGLLALADDSDAEQKSTIISFSSALYDTAIDVDDYYADLTDIDEDDVNESVSRPKKTDIKKALDSLTIAEAVIRKKGGYSDIHKAIKDIKSELIRRGLEK